MTSSSDVEKEPSSLCNGKRAPDILDVVGEDGAWQRGIFLVMILCAIPSATHNLAMTFLAPEVDHWCARPVLSNISVEDWKNMSLPPKNGACYRYQYSNLSHSDGVELNHTGGRNTDLIACTRWEYDETFYATTVTSQWNLVCDREWLISLSKSIYMAGFLVSVFLFGHLSDRMGRRPVVSWCAAIAVCSAVICTFSTSFIMFAAARFCVAAGISGVFTTLFVLLMEVVGPNQRSVYGIAVEFGWCLGFVCLPAIAWLLRDWFWIQLALTAPCLLLLPIWWFVPESPRWLLSQGRTEEAKKFLRKAAEKNGKNVDDVDIAFKNFAKDEESTGTTKAGTVLDLLRTPGLWQKTLNLYFIWFVNAFVYYGLTYNTNELAGDPFINFAVSGAVEFPAYCISILVIRSQGRRRPLAGAMLAGGVACLIAPSLPPDPWWLSVSVSTLGKFCITCSFAVAFVYTTEIFPTVVRNVGLGTASLCARFGSIIAPFVRELGHATNPFFPMLVFGVLSMLGGLMVLLLPETQHQTVPDTLEEAAQRGRHKKPKPTVTKPSQNGYTIECAPDADSTTEILDENAPIITPPISTKNGKKLDDVPEEELESGHELTTLPEFLQQDKEDDLTVTEVPESSDEATNIEQITSSTELECVSSPVSTTEQQNDCDVPSSPEEASDETPKTAL